jgi:hypothetical protein
MQRAAERETIAAAAEATADAEAEKRAAERWHAPGFEPGAEPPDGRVVVTYLPRSAMMRHKAPTRISFGGFNKETERRAEENAAREKRIKAAAAAARAKDADVTDAEMAAALTKSTDAKRPKKKTPSGEAFRKPAPLAPVGGVTKRPEKKR